MCGCHAPSQGKVFENGMRDFDFGSWIFGYWILGFFFFLVFSFDLVNLTALCGVLGGQEGVFLLPCDLTSCI